MTDQPNILLILPDEHGAEFASTYGHPIVRTPNIDALADGGMTFDRAYCASPLCVPSRMAMMTGRYVHREGIWDNGVPLRSDAVTIAHILRNSGYETALAGKMHFVGCDKRHGFEHGLVPDMDIYGASVSIDRMWRHSIEERPKARARFAEAGPGTGEHIDHDLAVTRNLLSWLERRSSDPGRTAKPFFVVAGYNSPHFPLIVPEPWASRYPPEEIDLPVAYDQKRDGQHPHSRRLSEMFGLGGLTIEEMLRARAAYYGLVSFIDDQIGELVQGLERLGLRDNTIVVYASDHGEMAGAHGLWWKSSFYESSVRIPMIFNWPGRIAAGRSNHLVSLLDLAVTLGDLGTRDGSREWFDGYMSTGPDGRSMLAMLTGDGPSEWPDHLFCDYYGHGSIAPMRMVRWGDLKLNLCHGEASEMYDLGRDPDELTDVADDPAYAEARAHMQMLARRDWDPETIGEAVRRSQDERWTIANGPRKHYRH